MTKPLLNRRRFALGSLASLGVGAASPFISNPLSSRWGTSRLLANTSLPHYFIQIVIDGGADNLYMLDSRPRMFTNANKIANYVDQEAELWAPPHGDRAFVSPTFANLKPYFDRIAVVNGVHMSAGFDGHEQNTNALLTSNPFGGVYFGPQFTKPESILSYLSFGTSFGTNITNSDGSLSMSSDMAPSLSKKAGEIIETSREAQAWEKSLHTSLERCRQGDGLFSRGCRNMQDGLQKSSELAKRLHQANLQFTDDLSRLNKDVAVAMSYFKAKVADVCLIFYDEENFDTHDFESAKNSAGSFSNLSTELSTLLKTLIETPYDANRGISMLDVTTVMIASEFGRTHGQAGKTATTTGTDHNPLGNSVIFAGKGIKAGQIIGATDLDNLNQEGAYRQISGAHKSIDPQLFKRMGKPFNFTSQQVEEQLPAEYDMSHYITAATLQNTMLHLFGVPQNDSIWASNSTARSNGPKKFAPVLSRLLI